MADTDNTPDDGAEPEKKPFVVPAAVGTVLGAGAGLGTAHYVARDAEKIKDGVNKANETLQKIGSGAKPEEIKAAEDAVEKAAGKLTALQELNKQEKTVMNFIKRPLGLLKNGDTKTKLAIVGATVAMGAATYIGTRAMMSPKKSTESFVDREQQRDMSRGTGAAPAV